MDEFTIQPAPNTVQITQQQRLSMASGPYYAAGQLTYDSGTGFWLGVQDGIARFSIGNSAGNKMTWDGITLTIVGSFAASSGTIGGWTIGADYIRDAAGVVGLSSAVTGGDDIRFWAGDSTPANAEFKVTESGALTAASGTIGGWTLGSTFITDASGLVGLSSAVTGGDDIRFWAGHTSPLSATFRVAESGAVTASNITITGGSVLSSLLSGLVGLANLNLSARGWTQTSAFSVLDLNTVQWGAGTFTSADGTSYSINAGNTGNMAARSFIYLDIAVSTTEYQTTTTASSAVGAGKVLVATAINGSVEPTFEVFSGVGGTNINGSQIVAASITGNEVAANTITAGNLTVSTLSAITADMGALTAGTITLNSSGHIKSGQTAYNTGTGFWLGYDSSVAKLSIGNASTKYLTWDGTTLTVSRLAVTEPDTQAEDTMTGISILSGPNTIWVATVIQDTTDPWSSASNKSFIGRCRAASGFRNAGHNIAAWMCDVTVTQVSAFEVSPPNNVTWNGQTWAPDEMGLRIVFESMNYLQGDEITSLNWSLMKV